MHFAMQSQSRSRLVSLGAVAALHAVAIYGLVTGLAGVIITRLVNHPTEGKNIPVTMPLPKLPKTLPHPQMNPLPQPESHPHIPFDPVPERWVDPVPQMPTADPIPQPHPSTSFTPKAAIPQGNPAGWATPDDYPGNDLRMNHAGITGFSLSIGADGRVASCVVTSSSGWPGLDAATCQLITRRARFTPATDETGARATGSFASAIHWVIPQ